MEGGRRGPVPEPSHPHEPKSTEPAIIFITVKRQAAGSLTQARWTPRELGEPEPVLRPAELPSKQQKARKAGLAAPSLLLRYFHARNFRASDRNLYSEVRGKGPEETYRYQGTWAGACLDPQAHQPLGNS